MPSTCVQLGPLLLALAGLAASWPVTAEPPSAGDQPALTVRIAYSTKLRRLPGWSRGLDCMVSRAGSILEDAIGSSLTIHSRLPWVGADAGRSPRELRAALVAEVERGGADLVLGIATHFRPPPPAPRPEGVLTPPDLDFTRDEGLASYTHGYLAIDIRGESLCDSYRLLAHEIAHLFGGVHRRGRRLLMDPEGGGVTVDPLNSELFALHQDRDFGIGKAPLTGDDLRTMWRLASADVEDPRTWLVVGVLAVKIGRLSAAVENYQRALAIDSDYTPAQINLGHVLFQRGELAAAIESYLRALETGGDDGLVANNLAAAYYGLGAPERALPWVEKAIAAGFAVHPGLIAEVEKATGKRIAAADR